MLIGKKIILRPLNSSDLSFLKQIENNSENWIFGSENKMFSDKELLEYISNSNTNIKDAKQFRWLIEFNNISTGFIDLYDYDKKKAFMGIIIDKNYRKKGIAKDAIHLIFKYAFDELKLEKLYSKVLNSNIPSINLFNSCGFKLDRKKDKFQIFLKLAGQ